MLGDPGRKVTSKRWWSSILPVVLLLASACILLTASAVASGETTIDDDLTLSAPTLWANDTYLISASITVAEGGWLTVANSTLRFDAGDQPIGVLVEPGGKLSIEGSDLEAVDRPYILEFSGEVAISGSTISGVYSVQRGGDQLFNVVGGLVIEGGSLELEGVTLMESDHVLLSAINATVGARNVTIEGAPLGVLLESSELIASGLGFEDVDLAFAAEEAIMDLTDVEVTSKNWTLWCNNSNIRIEGLDSRAAREHVGVFESELLVIDSTFVGGSQGVIAFGGRTDVLNCTFDGTSVATELYYSQGSMVGNVAEGCTEDSYIFIGIPTSATGDAFVFDRNVARGGFESGVFVHQCQELAITNLTVEGCGNGVTAYGSIISVADTLITGVTECQPTGCSYRATGTGIDAESTIATLDNVTVEGSNGPGMRLYYSNGHVNSSSFVDGNHSGIVVTYGDLDLSDCEVAGNRLYGIDVHGFEVAPGSLDAEWGNGLADIRFNVTIVVRVVDAEEKWLYHANVTCASGDLSLGPFETSFAGTTSAFQLTLYEFTYPDQNSSYDPWDLTASYRGFTDTTEVLVRDAGTEVVLVVNVLRADLVLEELKAPKTLEKGGTATISAKVANRGDHAAEDVVLTFYYRNEEGFKRVIEEVSLGTIEPGGTADGSVEWTMDETGLYTVGATVDVNDEVDEKEEDNNDESSLVEVEEEEDTPGPGVLLALLALAAAVVLRRRRG